LLTSVVERTGADRAAARSQISAEKASKPARMMSTIGKSHLASNFTLAILRLERLAKLIISPPTLVDEAPPAESSNPLNY
jgi:hypothetical protein